MIFRRAMVCLLAGYTGARALGAAEAAGAAVAPSASNEPRALMGAATSAGAAASAPSSVPLVPTVIESGAAEMSSTEKETTFTFRNGVTVTGTNMKITCDELVVVAKRSGDAAATVGKQENFKSLIATGNVRILQSDREATCGRAAVYPGDDKVELTENPVVRSIKEGWTQTGPKMVLYRGQRRAVIEGTATERPKLILPPLKDLGYEKEKAKDKAGGEAEKKPEPADTLKPAPADKPTTATPEVAPLTVPIPPQPK
jgi:lipopolysaccharide export system protein LptA